MLIRLIIKYFFYNRRRTYRAVAILSVGLALVLSTDMLMSGYFNQIEEFASLVDDSSSTLQVVYHGDYLDPSDLEELIRVLEESTAVSSYITMYRDVVNLHSDNSSLSAELMISDLHQLQLKQWISLSSDLINSTTYISNLHGDLLLASQLELSTSPQIIVNQTDSYIALDQFTPDLLMDRTNTDLPIGVEDRVNEIIVFVNSQQYGSLRQDLTSLDGVYLIEDRPANVFLQVSAGQVTQILLLLQFGMSLLLILSISYVMITLVMESEEEIRIFNMLGLGKAKIFMIFLGQSVMAAAISCVVSFLFSITLLYSILPFITLVGLPYGTIALNFDFTILTFLQAMLVGILAGLYPAARGSDLL